MLPALFAAVITRLEPLIATCLMVGAGGWTIALTVTDPSTPRLFATVNPGETIVMPAPPLTMKLNKVNLSPTLRPGPRLTIFKMLR